MFTARTSNKQINGEWRDICLEPEKTQRFESFKLYFLAKPDSIPLEFGNYKFEELDKGNIHKIFQSMHGMDELKSLVFEFVVCKKEKKSRFSRGHLVVAKNQLPRKSQNFWEGISMQRI